MLKIGQTVYWYDKITEEVKHGTVVSFDDDTVALQRYCLTQYQIVFVNRHKYTFHNNNQEVLEDRR